MPSMKMNFSQPSLSSFYLKTHFIKNLKRGDNINFLPNAILNGLEKCGVKIVGRLAKVNKRVFLTDPTFSAKSQTRESPQRCPL